MDKKDIIRGVLLAMVLVAAWVGLKLYWQHAHPEWFLPAPEPSAQTDANAATQPSTAPTTQLVGATQPSSTQPSEVASAATAPTTGPSVASSGPSVQAGFTIVRPTSAEDTRPVRIGSDAADDPTWPMQLSLDPLGASVNSVTLNAFKRSEDFKKPVKDRRLYEFEQPYSGRTDSQPLATRSLTIKGQSVSLDAREPGRRDGQRPPRDLFADHLQQRLAGPEGHQDLHDRPQDRPLKGV
jgi:hypothetical protein